MSLTPSFTLLDTWTLAAFLAPAVRAARWIIPMKFAYSKRIPWFTLSAIAVTCCIDTLSYSGQLYWDYLDYYVYLALCIYTEHRVRHRQWPFDQTFIAAEDQESPGSMAAFCLTLTGAAVRIALKMVLAHNDIKPVPNTLDSVQTVIVDLLAAAALYMMVR